LATTEIHLLLALFMGLAAALFTSVGHAGASAYLALMALFGVTTSAMRPTALLLNIFAAGFASWRYVRAGQFRWRTLWPFLAGAVPFAFVGGSFEVPGHVYRPLVGLVLLVAAARLLWPINVVEEYEWKDPPVPVGLLAGAGIGLLSGLTGTGGGLFLSPLLLFAGWSSTRITVGVVAVFILCTSAAGLLGNLVTVRSLPPELPIYVAAVLIGALGGTTMGLRLPSDLILKLLGVVLCVAGLKFIGILS
jgi:hypothetical protein